MSPFVAWLNQVNNGWRWFQQISTENCFSNLKWCKNYAMESETIRYSNRQLVFRYPWIYLWVKISFRPRGTKSHWFNLWSFLILHYLCYYVSKQKVIIGRIVCCKEKFQEICVYNTLIKDNRVYISLWK